MFGTNKYLLDAVIMFGTNKYLLDAVIMFGTNKYLLDAVIMFGTNKYLHIMFAHVHALLTFIPVCAITVQATDTCDYARPPTSLLIWRPCLSTQALPNRYGLTSTTTRLTIVSKN